MISFWVKGIPVPQGSAVAMTNRHTGKAILLQSNRSALIAWRNSINLAAQQACDGKFFDKGEPVSIALSFVLLKPPSAPRKRKYPVTKPDLDKLTRAALDALTGVAYADDSQVVSINVSKFYALPHQHPGVHVSIDVPVSDFNLFEDFNSSM